MDLARTRPVDRKARWLVVDPDLVAGERSVAFLRGNGLDSGLVHTARRALELLRSSIPVDGILCEIRLPRTDGFELCDEIRKLPGLARPVFLMSSIDDAGERAVAEQVGAHGILLKPLGLAVLPRLAQALTAPPPLAVVVGQMQRTPDAQLPERPRANTLMFAPPPERPRADSQTFARCNSCSNPYVLPDEIQDDRELVLCPPCLSTGAP